MVQLFLAYFDFFGYSGANGNDSLIRGVVGAPHGEVPVALVALRIDRSLTEDQLRTHARKLLADYKVPERILFASELPKGLTGKVDRRSLRDMLIAQPDLLEQRVVAGV